MTFTQKSAISRILTLGGLLCLIARYVTIHAIKGEDILLRTTISVLPLAIFIPGLLKRQYRTASLLCFVLLIYFIPHTQALFVEGHMGRDIFLVGLVSTLFIVAMFYARWQQRADVYEGEIHAN